VDDAAPAGGSVFPIAANAKAVSSGKIRPSHHLNRTSLKNIPAHSGVIGFRQSSARWLKKTSHDARFADFQRKGARLHRGGRILRMFYAILKNKG
jgi:hypothetical protein